MTTTTELAPKWGELCREPRSAFSTATHSQFVEFEHNGRAYWGTVYRGYNRDAAAGQRTTYYVALRARNTAGNSYAVGAKQLPAIRAELVKAFRNAVAAWAAAL